MYAMGIPFMLEWVLTWWRKGLGSSPDPRRSYNPSMGLDGCRAWGLWYVKPPILSTSNRTGALSQKRGVGVKLLARGPIYALENQEPVQTVGLACQEE